MMALLPADWFGEMSGMHDYIVHNEISNEAIVDPARQAIIDLQAYEPSIMPQ